MDDGLTPSQRANAALVAVERRFEQIMTALTRANVPFAIVGNQATSLWIATIDEGATRNARDTEVLVNDSDFETASQCAIAIGLVPLSNVSIPCFVDKERPSSRNVVRLFVANRKVVNDDALPAPELTDIERLGKEIPVLPLELHITWQLVRFRLDDRVDLIDMMGVGLVRTSLCDELPPLLAARLCEMFDAFAKEREGFRY